MADLERNTQITEEETGGVATAVSDTESSVNTAGVQIGDTTEEKIAEEIPYAPLRKHGFRYGCYCFVKRTFDIVSAGSLFLVASPIILLLLLVKFLEDFHNPIYVSKRVGRDGKVFNFLKIRTMKVGADKEKAELEKQGRNEMDGPVFKIKDDPRVTRVGRFYRRFSLDELLQLLNIVFGSMSVVGPRPPLPSEVEKYDAQQRHRLDVKGGLLCFWQIQPNRNALSFNEWVDLDIAYIEQQSILTDLKIIFKGAWMVIFDHSGV